MKLEDLQLEVRPRPHWQSIDLGFSLLYHNARAVFLPWSLLWGSLTLIAMALALISPTWASIGSIGMWFLRPLAERLIVHILAREVFGQKVSTREAFKALPAACRHGWFSALTWWRLLRPGRSLLQPIWQLENAVGNHGHLRRKQLSANSAIGVANFWGIACVHFETVLWIALLALPSLFWKTEETANPFYLLSMAMYGDDRTIISVFSVLAYGIATGFVAPIYTACGFTLYLGRRAELEGWDLELSLRRLLRRREATVARPLRKVILLLLTFALPALANDPVDCPPPEFMSRQSEGRLPAVDAEQRHLRKTIDSIQALPEMRDWKCEEQWVAKEDKKDSESDDSGFWEFLAKLLKPLGKFMGEMAWWIRAILIGAAVAFVLWLLWRFRGLIASPGRENIDVFIPAWISENAMDRPQNLPKNLTDSVLALWNEHKHREALGMLLIATLVRLAESHSIVLEHATTENRLHESMEEAVRAQKLSAFAHGVYVRVLSMWMRAAWGNRYPETAALEVLCQDWNRAPWETQS